MFEQIGDGTFKKSDLAGNHNGYVKAEAVTYFPTLKEQRVAQRTEDGAEVIRILDAGIDRTPQQL